MNNDDDLSEREEIILSVIKFASTLLTLVVVPMFGTLPLKIRHFRLNKVKGNP